MVVPLFAAALATISTVPEAPATHATVIVPLPMDTMLAMGPLVGFATENCPVYGEENVTGAGVGGRLYVPVAVKVTWPLGKLCASAAAGVTAIEVRTRPMYGFADEPHDNAPLAASVTIAKKKEER